MDENVTDVTETVPTLDPSTRSKIKGALLAVTAAGAALLLVDDQWKKFKGRKNVTVIVADNPTNETTSA